MPLLTPPSPPPARVAELKQKILNATEMLLNQLLARMERRVVPRPPARGRLHKAMERRAPDGFALWRLCNRSSCRRAGGCRRNPWECLPRYLKRRPPDCAAAVVAKWKQLQKDIGYIGIDAPEPRTATELDILMAETAESACSGKFRVGKAKRVHRSPKRQRKGFALAQRPDLLLGIEHRRGKSEACQPPMPLT